MSISKSKCWIGTIVNIFFKSCCSTDSLNYSCRYSNLLKVTYYRTLISESSYSSPKIVITTLFHTAAADCQKLCHVKEKMTAHKQRAASSVASTLCGSRSWELLFLLNKCTQIMLQPIFVLYFVVCNKSKLV